MAKECLCRWFFREVFPWILVVAGAFAVLGLSRYFWYEDGFSKGVNQGLQTREEEIEKLNQQIIEANQRSWDQYRDGFYDGREFVEKKLSSEQSSWAEVYKYAYEAGVRDAHGKRRDFNLIKTTQTAEGNVIDMKWDIIEQKWVIK